MNTNSPIVKHLVLIGGGHSHLAVLKKLGMKPVPGLLVTLISRDIYTPYSGAMPAYIAGHYEQDEMHIDLRPLAQFAKVRLLQASVESIDLEKKTIQIPGRPLIPFDLVSLNIGSSPNASLIKGSIEHGVPVKPIDEFLEHWQSISEAAVHSLRNAQAYTLAIIGGGPASVELAFAAQYKIHSRLGLTPDSESRLQLKVVSSASAPLNTHNKKAQQAVLSEFKKRHIEFLGGSTAAEIQAKKIILDNGDELEADSIVFATGASIPRWPADCGLRLSDDGFIEVNEYLQSTSHPFVFAAGDAATIKGHSRPKSGVYAVRQGKTLATNLIRAATSKSLKNYTPQKHALALVNLGNKSALAIRQSLFLKGRSVWALKNVIDRRFVRKYSELPTMEVQLDIASGLVDQKTESELKAHAMRCAGCGAKVAASVLQEVLKTLPSVPKTDVVDTGGSIEDASQINLSGGRNLVQSIDQIKAFTGDPWLFGKIASNHCLSDIYAMGVEPHSALAVAGIPHASRGYTQSQLSELMHGCAEALAENECALIGGHSAETLELQLGLCINGFSSKAVLSKNGFNVGDVLILTKALGTGTLLAADMRYRASHFWMQAAIESMLVSNKQASKILLQHEATACTDITGFGLAGHVLEMLASRGAKAEISLNSLPVLSGALESLSRGILSSLHLENSRASERITNWESFKTESHSPLLFDPQTSGGLLATVKPEYAASCLSALQEQSHCAASIVGAIVSEGESEPSIVLK